ncbi:hypothetical protein [Lactiplantibacillus plantarum]|uniref:hypothetical protein n=1 Tax=Lactiplantibacillus plantarum TaxID=1590 RepID=UPI001BA77CCC|nr:hypothetical protein [Lactiplantibacillus plantarum]MBS0955009.1 hypothetical protein [Lactiplantibacillus plantarum]
MNLASELQLFEQRISLNFGAKSNRETDKNFCMAFYEQAELNRHTVVDRLKTNDQKRWNLWYTKKHLVNVIAAIVSVVLLILAVVVVSWPFSGYSFINGILHIFTGIIIIITVLYLFFVLYVEKVIYTFDNMTFDELKELSLINQVAIVNQHKIATDDDYDLAYYIFVTAGNPSNKWFEICRKQHLTSKEAWGTAIADKFQEEVKHR